MKAMLRKFAILILMIKILSTQANDCYTHLMQTVPDSYTCSSSGLFTSSSFNPIVQNPSKQLTVAVSIRPSDFCGLNGLINVVTVSYHNFLKTPHFNRHRINTNIGRKKVMMLTYDRPNSKFVFRTEDTTTTHSFHDRPGVFLAKPINIYMSVNLASGSNSFSVGALMDDNDVGTLNTMSYGSTWIFDSSLRISVCADDDGTNLFGSVECLAMNLKVAYSFYNPSSVIDFTNTATIIGDYKLENGEQNILTNSLGILPSITLPTTTTTSPAWVADVGLDFTSASQSVQIPTFSPSSSGLTLEVSFSITFYIKFASVPTSPTTIFSYYVNSISQDMLHVKLNPNMKLQNYMETNSQEGWNVLSTGRWYQLYLGCAYSSGGLGVVFLTIDGSLGDSSPSIPRFGASTIFSPTDVIKVGGGFIGQVRRIKIFTPGAAQLAADTCSPTTCTVHIAYNDSPMCIFSVCGATSGTYSSIGTCEKCKKGCAACSDATTCQSCDPKYYLLGTDCLDCPPRCASCTDPQTCQSCNPGYGLLNNFCVVCPAGTYLSSDGICKTVSETIQDTLEKSQLLNSATTQATSVISQGSAVSLSATVSGKIFSQIKYLNVSFSGELQVALLTWLPSFVSLGLTPNLPDSIIVKIPTRNVSSVFQKYDVSSSFLINFWENLGIIVSVTVMWLTFKGLELAADSKSKIGIMLRRVRVFIQNFLITAMFGVYGDLVLYSLVEYRSFVFGWNLSLLSFLFSIILLMAMFVSFFYQIRLLLNYQKVKKQPDELEKFTKTHEGSQVLFKDMKDYSLAPQLFLFFLSGRDLIFSLLLATMFEYPFMQALIFFILTCLMIAYLLIKRPFESTFDLIQQIFFEVISFTVSICVMINAFLDSGNYVSKSVRASIGKVLIVFNMIFNFGTGVFMFFALFSLLKEAYTQCKQKANKNMRTIKPNNQLQRPAAMNEKSNNIIDLSHISNQNLIMNLDSEMNSFHRQNTETGTNNTERDSSPQHLNFQFENSFQNKSKSSLSYQQRLNRIKRVSNNRQRYDDQMNSLDQSPVMLEQRTQPQPQQQPLQHRQRRIQQRARNHTSNQNEPSQERMDKKKKMTMKKKFLL